MPVGVRVVVALTAEARPLVEGWRMKGAGSGPFRLYRGGDDRWLVVSGIGKVASAAATVALHHTAGTTPAVWINVGICGHRDGPLGDGVLAHRIVDHASGAAHFPPLAFPWDGREGTVRTVDRPELGYPGDDCYEMEASGFYPTACRFATAELVHCYKVISDTAASPPSELDARRITELVATRRDEVDRLAASARQLAAALPGDETEAVEPFTSRWRLTVTQRRQLEALMRRARALGVEVSPDDPDLVACRRGGEVVAGIRRRLDAAPVRPF